MLRYAQNLSAPAGRIPLRNAGTATPRASGDRIAARFAFIATFRRGEVRASANSGIFNGIVDLFIHCVVICQPDAITLS
ncbi:hypothetical protein KCP77_18160 [Salmonella enterica subsp. enterica]|nr:hypothetical protein KCP77_18160 [Salmonella enterica subsp. enterica]